MRHRFILPLLFTALALLSGCFERTEKITLNPDGSGKSYVEFTLQSVPDNPALNALTPREQARKRAADLIHYAKGIDAWKDVAFEPGPDGSTRFKATVYFRDIAKYKVDQIGLLRFDWTKDKDPQAGMTLTIGKGGIQPDQRPPGDAAPTDEQVADQIKALRQQWNDPGMQKLTALLRNLKIDITFILPARADATSILQNTPDGVRYQIDGKKFIASAEARIKDDARLAAEAKAGESITNPSEELTNQILFGVKAKATAHVPGELKPLFDYNAEMDAAKKAEPAMMRHLGLSDDAPTALPMETPVTPQPVPQP